MMCSATEGIRCLLVSSIEYGSYRHVVADNSTYLSVKAVLMTLCVCVYLGGCRCWDRTD